MKYTLDNLICDSKNIIDKVSVKANSAFNVSKAYVEKAQVKVKLQEKYCELGKTCYEMHKSGNDETGNMKKLIKEIKLLEIQLEDAEEASGKPKTCAFCGAKNSCDNTFCAKCGEKL